jgi:endonuclease/exonuclease/phosphatase (EEP) superfamily protein YafD
MRWLDRLLAFCAAVVVLVSLLPLGARLSWMLDLTTHFRVQYLAAALLMLGLLALRRRWRICALLGVAAAISAAPLIPYLPWSGGAGPSSATPLTVMTVNVSYRQFSVRRLLEMIRELNPDVLVMQELTPSTAAALTDLDTTFAHHLKFPADGPYGIALWSQHALEGAQLFALGRLPAIEARVLAPSGPFAVFGVHLSAPTTPRRAAARDEELRQLAARSAAVDGALLVAGDFNLTPYSPQFSDWLDASGLTDTRRGRTLSVSWPTLLPLVGIPIDHVAVSSEFEILSHRRLPDFGSDHYGVLVELALRADAPERK